MLQDATATTRSRTSSSGYASNGAIDFGARAELRARAEGLGADRHDRRLGHDRRGRQGLDRGRQFNADIDAAGLLRRQVLRSPTRCRSASRTSARRSKASSPARASRCAAASRSATRTSAASAPGYTWGGSLKFMAGTCDVGNWRAGPAERQRGLAGRPSGSRCRARQRGVLVSVRGMSKAPEVELRGPGGVVVRTRPTATRRSGRRPARVRQPRREDHLRASSPRPRGGRWTVKAAPGSRSPRSRPRAAARRLGEREGPRSRPGAEGRLPHPAPEGPERDLRGARARRRARARHGPRRAGAARCASPRPTAAGGRRTVVALVEQNGLPRKRLTVATLQGAAAGQARVAAATSRSHGRRRGRPRRARSAARALTITWKAATAGRSLRRARRPAGRPQAVLPARRRRARRAHQRCTGRRPRDRPGRGLRADNGTGPAATANSSLSGGTQRCKDASAA